MPETGSIYHPRGVFYEGTGAFITADLPASGSARMVLCALAGHAGERPYVWPSVGRIAEILKVSARTVHAGLRELLEIGLIRAVGRVARRVAYVFLWHPALEAKRVRQVIPRTYTDTRVQDALNDYKRRDRGTSATRRRRRTPAHTSSATTADPTLQNLQTSPIEESCTTRSESSQSSREALPTGRRLGEVLRDISPRPSSGPYPPGLAFELALDRITRTATSRGYTALSQKQHRRLVDRFLGAPSPELLMAHCSEVLDFAERDPNANPVALIWARIFKLHLLPADQCLREAKAALYGCRRA